MQPTFLRGAESEGATAAMRLSVGRLLLLADRLIRIQSYPTPGLCPLLIQELPPTKAGDLRDQRERDVVDGQGATPAGATASSRCAISAVIDYRLHGQKPLHVRVRLCWVSR